MFIKAYAKTHGSARLYPIFAPINMGHINADGFLASCVARYTQVRTRRLWRQQRWCVRSSLLRQTASAGSGGSWQQAAWAAVPSAGCVPARK